MVSSVATALPKPRVKLPRKVVNMHAHMVEHAGSMNGAVASFMLLTSAEQRREVALLRRLVALSRPLFGLVANPTSIGSVFDPAKGVKGSNVKIDKNKVKTISFTFQAAKGCRVELPSCEVLGVSQRMTLVLNMCSWSGLCEALCVLQHGRGKFSSVRAGRNWRTYVLWAHPEVMAVLMYWEIGRAGVGVDELLLRANVDSDQPWHLVPNLFVGLRSAEVHDVPRNPLSAYDYTKDPDVLSGDGWALPNYRRVYSLHERSDEVAVAAFMRRGGNTAVVTDRDPGGDTLPFGVIDGQAFDIVDGDLSDNRFDDPRGVLIDLYAKGSAQNRRSAFVRPWYSTAS